MTRKTIALLLLATIGTSQSTPDLPSLEASQTLLQWRADHGARWKTITTRGTGRPDLLYGGLAQPSGAPTGDAGFAAAATDFLGRTQGIHGMQPETLTLDLSLIHISEPTRPY